MRGKGWSVCRIWECRLKKARFSHPPCPANASPVMATPLPPEARGFSCLARASQGVTEGLLGLAKSLLRVAGVLPGLWGSAPCLYLPAASRRVMNWRTFGILVLASNWKAAVLLAAMTGSVAYQ